MLGTDAGAVVGRTVFLAFSNILSNFPEPPNGLQFLLDLTLIGWQLLGHLDNLGDQLIGNKGDEPEPRTMTITVPGTRDT